MSDERDRSFFAEYRGIFPGDRIGYWVKVAGNDPVTYQEACAEILAEMEDDKISSIDMKYQYRIVDVKGDVVLDGAELVAEPVVKKKGRDWDAEGMPEAEILRRWKIVDAMIEELDDLRFERDDAKTRLADALGQDEENRHYTGLWAERLVSLTDDVIELETWLKIGLEED